MPQISNIPGGADTQVANVSGNPEAVGLSPEQTGQAEDAYMRSIARGPDMLRSQQDLADQPTIPMGQTGDMGYIPEEGAPQDQQQQPQEEYEQVRATLPTGEVVQLNVPKGMSDEDIRWKLIDMGEKGFEPDGSVLERTLYGAMQGDNITENVGNWAKSHFPYLAGEYRVDGNGIRFIPASEKYGADFEDLTPQQRRERIDEVDAKLLAESMPNVHPKNLGTAGTVGAIGTAIADPAALLPGGAAVKGATSVASAALRTGGVGAAWGGVYGLSDVAATQGLPTTLEELASTAPTVAENAAMGGLGGAVLGGAGRKVMTHFTERAHRVSLNPEKAATFARREYWPKFWDLQAQGQTSAQASSTLRRKFNLSLDDEWRLRQSLVDIDNSVRRKVGKKAKEKNIVLEETLPERQGTAIYSPAEGADDALRRAGEARTANWGDPILHGSFQKHVDDLFRPIAGVVKDISPRVYSRLMNMEGAILRKTKEYHMQFEPFMKDARKFMKSATEKEQKRFSAALYNSDVATGRNLWLQKGLPIESYNAMRQGLDRLEQEMLDAGVNINSIEGYFPRIVADFDGFRKHTGRGGKLTGLDKALKDAANAKKRKLTDAETNSVINNYMEPGRKRNKKKTVRSEKARGVKEVTDDLLPFYHDPMTSLEFHLREALSKAERARFFGKAFRSKDGVDDISASVGELVKNEVFDPANVERLREVLEARFGMGEQSGNVLWSTLRSGTGGVTLGNPSSALRQLGDIPSVMKTQGVANTLASMFKRVDPEMNADAFGYMLEMAQELDTKGAASRIRALSQGLYKYSGFRSVDRFGKNTLIKAATRNAMKMAKTKQGRIKFAQKYGNIYSKDEMIEIMGALQKGEFPDIVKAHINAEIMRIQPISRSQMPLAYLNNPNGRLAYQFRTWGLNQIELFRQDVWRGLKSPVPSERRRAARQAVAWLAGIGTTNVAITEGQRILTNREGQKAEEIPEEVIWQALGNFALFDRYGIEKAVEQGDSEAYLNSFLPPSVTIPGTIGLKMGQFAMGEDAGSKDAFRAVIKQTGLGRMFDFWMMGGAEEYNEKLKKRRESDENERQTTDLDKKMFGKGGPYAQ